MHHRAAPPRRPRHRRWYTPSTAIPWAWALAAWPLHGTAQTAEPPPGAPAPAAPRIEVRGDGSAQRRADVAGRQIVGREELLRHGDTRLVDALQRLPGLSVEQRGSGTELKLGGLGEGYTQVLLNGEPLPRGTSLDSIALDSLERVEVLRGASVQSAQAIAGSINLVTRRATASTPRELKLQLGSQWGRPQASATLNFGGQTGAARWGLGLVLADEQQQWPAHIEQTRWDDGTLTQRSLTHKRETDRTRSWSLNPRASWQQTAADSSRWQFSTDHSLRLARSSGGVSDQREALEGAAPAQQTTDMALHYDRLFWRGRVQAQHRSAEGHSSELRLNFTHARRDQRARSLGSNFSGQPVQDTAVDGVATDQAATLNLNHQRAAGPAHRLDLGSEWEVARRSEDRVQSEQALPGGLPPLNLDERYQARAQRWALYAQDDWTWSAQTTLQAGLRLERLDTVSEGNVFERVRQQHRLLGPVLRLATEPSRAMGSFKLGLSRGFKLPVPRDVMPRRYVPTEVSATAPAMAGNPDLRPERAWSLDGSWQRAVPALKGEWVVSAALRRIDDVILDRLLHQPSVPEAPWLLQRFNAGRAWSAGLDFEWRGQATGLLAAGPLRWQTSLSLARSKLLDVAGDRPALAGQAPWALKLDLTQPLAPGWTAQLGLQARGAARADQPSARRLESLARHSWNGSLAWQRSPQQSWRLSAAPLGRSEDVDLKTVQVTEGGRTVVYRAREAWQRGTLWRLALDSRF